ncbi:MAG TPA: beta-galactosidase [Terriglobales bacterium]
MKRAILVLLFCSITVSVYAQTRASYADDKIRLGTAWYPEQWPEARWEQDLQLMQNAGINMVRVGEFAWSRMEPAEGRYDLDWLERAVAAAGKHKIQVVLGTPTAAPPAWLTTKYPDTLRIGKDGRRAQHGNRQHFSFTSPRYREFCRSIAAQMAQRFGHNANVIGWQIDNEYAEPSYDDYTRKQFQQWLQRKYKTLDALNAHWTTSYWSQTYDDWAEIPIPVDGGNPGLVLEWRRFISDTWRDYQRNQLEALRSQSDPRQFITTNFMGFFDGFDHYVVASDLDIASWDDYVGQGQLDPAMNGMTHDLTRGFKQRNFWVMETQPGAVNWAPINNFLNKGEVRAMAWQAIGHGAETVSYWQWRSALNGQEEYHGTLVGADGTPVPLYEEVAQIGREFQKANDWIRGTSPSSQVALLYDYDSRWAIDNQKHTKDYDQLKVLKSYYAALRALTQSLDVVNPYADLSRYKLVVAPDLNLIPDDLAKRLSAYVQAGGHLVLGPRSGMKDQFNALLTERQPGLLTETLGGRVEQFYALDEKVPVAGDWGSGEAPVWAEQLKASAPDVQVPLKYGKSNGWLDDQAAVLTRNVGRGSLTYIGAVLDDDLTRAAAKWMVSESGVAPLLGTVPQSVEVCMRQGGGKRVFILINHSQQQQSVSLPHAMTALSSGQQTANITLPAYGVDVLRDSASQ